MRLISNSLSRKGYMVRPDSFLYARKGTGQVIHVSAGGLCWSRVDPSDAIVPLIPGILAMPKQVVRPSVLAGMYGTTPPFDRHSFKFTARLESFTTWKALRESGECGLTPDEKTAASVVLGLSKSKIAMVSDFPTEGCQVRRYGRLQYYDSSLDPTEASETLRVVGMRGARNAYLPDSGILTTDSDSRATRAKLAELSEELGEWCYFRTG